MPNYQWCIIQKMWLLAVHNRALDLMKFQSIIDYNRWLFQHWRYNVTCNDIVCRLRVNILGNKMTFCKVYTVQCTVHCLKSVGLIIMPYKSCYDSAEVCRMHNSNSFSALWQRKHDWSSDNCHANLAGGYIEVNAASAWCIVPRLWNHNTPISRRLPSVIEIYIIVARTIRLSIFFVMSVLHHNSRLDGNFYSKIIDYKSHFK